MIQDNETYSAMELREHILEVPDTYIGGTEQTNVENAWIYEEEMSQEDILVSLGFYNIFNEVLTNASDQCIRTRNYALKDKTVQITKNIKISIQDNVITIWNDGDGIPITEHPEKKVWTPELIFGTLLTSSNYKKKLRFVGGKNGLGAKVANIYSTSFEVETVDHRRKKKFYQRWEDNMSPPEQKAKITSYRGKAYTKITFKPDYARFGMDGLEGDILFLLKKRAYDIAGITSKDVNVYFNDEKIPIKSFDQYAKLYTDDKFVYDTNDFWQVAVCASPDGNFRQVSFVNGICTINGGKHVDYIANKISKELTKRINGKKGDVKTTHVKTNLWVFINSLIQNPSFSNQTKEALITPSSKFGSTCNFNKKFYDKLMKTPIVQRSKLMKSFHDKSKLSKTDGKKTKTIRGIPKLDDAEWAGGPRSSECTLILTEGDSAKSMVTSGLSIVGRDKYGVYPLRGKLLNVRDASDKSIMNCEEIQNLKKILGLQQNSDTKDKLRYGRVLILTDQDLHGIHIRGLTMNLFACDWEDLMKSGLLVTMYTPVVKIKKGKKVVKVFYNEQDYHKWKDSLEDKAFKAYTAKYYKGLGTSDRDEAREYFKNMNIVNYQWSDESGKA
jgi:DNA topoisomerase-2